MLHNAYPMVCMVMSRSQYALLFNTAFCDLSILVVLLKYVLCGASELWMGCQGKFR